MYLYVHCARTVALTCMNSITCIIQAFEMFKNGHQYKRGQTHVFFIYVRYVGSFVFVCERLMKIIRIASATLRN